MLILELFGIGGAVKIYSVAFKMLEVTYFFSMIHDSDKLSHNKSSAVVDTMFVDIYVDTKNIPTCRYDIQHIDKRTMKKQNVNNRVRSCNELCKYF